MLRGAGGLSGLVSTTPSKVLGPWSQCYSKGDGSSFCSPACLEFSSQPWLQLEPLTPKYSPELLKTSTKNTIASPAYSSENYCTTEGAATKSRDKTNKFMCFAIQWESAFWARLFIKLPQGKFLLHVTNCHRSSQTCTHLYSYLQFLFGIAAWPFELCSQWHMSQPAERIWNFHTAKTSGGSEKVEEQQLCTAQNNRWRRDPFEGTGTIIRERGKAINLKTDKAMSTELGKPKRHKPAAIILQACTFSTWCSGCFGLVLPALTGFSPRPLVEKGFKAFSSLQPPTMHKWGYLPARLWPENSA